MAQPNSSPAPLVPRRSARERLQALRAARPARWWATWAAALAALAAVAVAAWALLADHSPTPGPLKTIAADSISGPQIAGEPFGFGLTVAYNTGDQDAVLDRVQLVNPTPGLRVLATYAAGPKRKFLWWSVSPTWPNPKSFSDLHPVAGARVAPAEQPAGKRGVEFVFALRADKPGRYNVKRVAVDYHVGDTKHHVMLRSGLLVCVHAPGQPKQRNCPVAPV